MAGEDMVMVRQGELKRLHVIQKILEGVIKQVEAAEVLSLSGRQIRRIVKRIRSEGDRGILHKSRGRPSNRRIGNKIKDRVSKLYRTQYKGLGPTLASEKLMERDRIEVSDETLRRWLHYFGLTFLSIFLDIQLAILYIHLILKRVLVAPGRVRRIQSLE